MKFRADSLKCEDRLSRSSNFGLRVLTGSRLEKAKHDLDFMTVVATMLRQYPGTRSGELNDVFRNILLEVSLFADR